VSISVGTGDSDQIEITGVQQVQSMLGGIPHDGARLGSPDAAVSVQVFNDLQCDPCSDWNRDVIVPLIRGPVRDGDLQLVFRHFLMTESGYFLGTFGAVAAAKQDYEWQFLQLFFLNQDEAEDQGADQEFLDNIARGVGCHFNVEQWQRDIDDEDVGKPFEDEEFPPAGFRRAGGGGGRAERERGADRVALARGGRGGDRTGEVGA
jgi:hypothetical protein